MMYDALGRLLTPELQALYAAEYQKMMQQLAARAGQSQLPNVRNMKVPSFQKPKQKQTVDQAKLARLQAKYAVNGDTEPRYRGERFWNENQPRQRNPYYEQPSGRTAGTQVDYDKIRRLNQKYALSEPQQQPVQQAAVNPLISQIDQYVRNSLRAPGAPVPDRLPQMQQNSAMAQWLAANQPMDGKPEAPWIQEMRLRQWLQQQQQQQGGY